MICTCLIENKRKETHYNTLIRLCVGMHLLASQITITGDSVPEFVNLLHDNILLSLDYVIHFSHVKDINKNSVTEHAITNLGEKLVSYDSSIRSISDMMLSVATSRLKSKIHLSGFVKHRNVN